MKTVINRQDALKQGLNKYFTGEQCRHGHLSERYTATTVCVQCHIERAYANAKRARETLKANRGQVQTCKIVVYDSDLDLIKMSFPDATLKELDRVGHNVSRYIVKAVNSPTSLILEAANGLAKHTASKDVETQLKIQKTLDTVRNLPI